MTANVKNSNVTILAKDSDQLVEIMQTLHVGLKDIDKVRTLKTAKE